MYKVEIKIGDWDFAQDEVVTIETSDFEKAQIIQEFIEFQKDYGWAVEYVAAPDDDEFDDEDEDDTEEELDGAVADAAAEAADNK